MPQKTSRQYSFFFGPRSTEGDASMKAILGGKGAKLAELSRAGIPVPPGFTVSTEACAFFTKHGGQFPQGWQDEIKAQMKKLEEKTGRKFGDPRNPLLVSVRTGAAMPMPGLLESVLNIGMNDKTVQGFTEKTGSERAAWDCYARCIAGLACVACEPGAGMTRRDFSAEAKRLMEKCGASSEVDLTAGQLKDLCDVFKRVYFEKVRKPFPQDPVEQLRLVMARAYQSWNLEETEHYRQSNRVTGLLGAALSVQCMVFGNLDEESGVGVAHTRDPVSGENTPTGSYLVRAQGDDLEAGLRPAKPLAGLADEASDLWRQAEEQLLALLQKLEKQCKHPQVVSFAIERGRLWILKSCNAHGTPMAGVRWAVEMATGRDIHTGRSMPKVLKPEEAVTMVAPGDLEQLLHPSFDADEEAKAFLLAAGQSSGPGAAAGKIVFSAREAEELVRKNKDEKLILVCRDTGPSDFSGMQLVQGILSTQGGVGSHAAVMARNAGKCGVTGASSLLLNLKSRTLSLGGEVLKEGDWLSLNGFKGAVYKGQLSVHASPLMAGLTSKGKEARKHPCFKLYDQVSRWCDEFRRMKVRANAEQMREGRLARSLGADGIGLCRTESMFFSGDRVWAVLEFVLADDKAARGKALSKLLPLQRADLEALFEAMSGLPVAVRLLDPPLDAFIGLANLPIEEATRRTGLTRDTIEARLKTWLETNPVLEHRGCRICIHYPEICTLQTRAILEAACNMEKKGAKVIPEIIIPFVGGRAEFDHCAKIVREEASRIVKERKSRLKFLIGAMIEVPRAALTAGEIAESAEFFSFGTNDLTQMTFGMSRENGGLSSLAMPHQRMWAVDPFQSLDAAGVGKLIEMAVKDGRDVRPGLACGVCGEHGGDPASIKFFFRTGLDYVSCPPSRIPVARLACAQAALRT
ncbi:MAG: pyruvate, phosphate dikinase [Lentisphaerota bacterium]